MARTRGNVNIMAFTVWLVLNNETHVLQIAVHGVYFFIFRVQQFRNLNMQYSDYCFYSVTTKEEETCFWKSAS